MPPRDTPLTPDTLRRAADACGVALPEAACLPLMTYLDLLTRWNKVMNLVGTRHWQDTFTTLIVDSFHLADLIGRLPATTPRTAWETWDLGAGAGLPGLPLRMLWQEGTYALVEAREKRALFLSTVLAHVSLPGVAVFKGRAEQFMTPSRRAHCILSRAFMPWEALLEFTGPHLHADGCIILLTRERVNPAPPWVVVDEHHYGVRGDTRHILALQQKSA